MCRNGEFSKLIRDFQTEETKSEENEHLKKPSPEALTAPDAGQLISISSKIIKHPNHESLYLSKNPTFSESPINPARDYRDHIANAKEGVEMKEIRGNGNSDTVGDLNLNQEQRQVKAQQVVNSKLIGDEEIAFGLHFL